MIAVRPILVDIHNIDQLAPILLERMGQSKLVGLDLETHDAGRHEGLNQFMRADAEGRKSRNRPLVFDVNRTVITGLSLYFDEDTLAYYINLAHADEENRVPWGKVKPILDALPKSSCFVAHNATFERTMLRNSLGYELPTTICTLQLAVSAYGPDEYDFTDFHKLDIKPIRPLLGEASKVFATFTDRNNMTGPQGELFAKFCGKESDSSHSYNGWTGEIARPYGLKQAVKYWFGVDMQTFEETLDGSVHMGKLTGNQVVQYGADDAVWAVRLYHRLIKYIHETNPAVIEAFFYQELPCVEYYSDVWSKGLRINKDAVALKRVEERVGYVDTLRKMKAVIRQLLPFPEAPHEGLTKYDGRPADGKSPAGWYYNGCANYRRVITRWATSPDDPDDFLESQKVQGPISNSWAMDPKEAKPIPKTEEELLVETLETEVSEHKLLEESLKKLKKELSNLKKAAKAEGILVDGMAVKNLDDQIAFVKGQIDLSKDQAGFAKASLKDAKSTAKSTGVKLSITYWSTARTLMYDLLGEKVILDKGKVQSDGEARGKMVDRLEKKLKALPPLTVGMDQNPADVLKEQARLKLGLELLACMSELSSVEQRAKLYLNPYTQLIDPETDRVYPVVSSKLASRRTSISHPNGQQLAKRGESRYIRGFYLADYDDHVILSEDWSGIELVLIGEFSQDPEFRKAFGQLPYQDLHLGATASCLGVVWGEDLTKNVSGNLSAYEKYGLASEDMTTPTTLMTWFLKKLKSMTPEEITSGHPGLLVNLKGVLMKPSEALKYWRTEVGKAANFGYWYSGALSDVGSRLGWSSDQMWKAVEGYREHFKLAEKWRTDLIDFARDTGYVQLPDGHRRVRLECTKAWSGAFTQKFSPWDDQIGVTNFLRTAVKAIQTRANNQVVNSMIQGSCATMMKRSIIRLRKAIKDAGYTDREMRVLIPIHDELLISVRKDLVVEAIKLCREAMCHPDIVTTLPLTVAPAIGRTFEPFIKDKRTTQIELGELSNVPCVSEDRWGQEATDDEVRAVVDWIFEEAA